MSPPHVCSACRRTRPVEPWVGKLSTQFGIRPRRRSLRVRIVVDKMRERNIRRNGKPKRRSQLRA